MKKLRIYLDTSVIGGCFDPEFFPWSNGLMKDLRLGHFEPVISDLVLKEILKAPQQVQSKCREVLDFAAEVLPLTGEVKELVKCYRKRKILNPHFESDMTHIALATVHHVDVLVSWNFKHIVHFDKIRQFNAINLESGYKPLDIRSPKEVTHYEERI